MAEVMRQNGLLFRLLAVLVVTVGIPSCAVQKEASKGWKQETFACGPGPEDAEIDPVFDRLLISCSARRKNEAFFGEIVALYQKEGKVSTDTLRRMYEPEGLLFQPHGISLVTSPMGDLLLYVVNHNDPADRQSILLYEVREKELVFKKRFEDELLVSPNSVLGMPDGSFYATNDSRKRGSRMEALLKIKGASVVYCSPEGKWKTVHDKICYANGLARRNDTLFLTSTRQHQLRLLKMEEQGKLSLLKEVKGLKGADNIRFYGNSLLIPGHPKPLKFIKHVSNPDKKSPSLVYKVDLPSLQVNEFFYDPGEGISASSSALFWKDYWWVVQVLDPFVLRISKTDQ